MMRKRAVSIIVCLTMLLMNAVSATSIIVSASDIQQSDTPSDTYESLEGRTITNPRIVKDDSMQAGQKVTWDCIWFGSYPQSEITSSDSLYNTLQNAAGWDANGDITLEDSKYRRIKKGDATFASSDSSHYDWHDEDTWHYFKYEPIKWRVLKIEGNQAFLLSDIVLDDQKYNLENEEITWETSTIRSWLNGYGSTFNRQKIDYSSKNFINSAFTAEERTEIADTAVINPDNISYGTAGGNSTKDKVFLLSEQEVYGSAALVHGWASSKEIYDEVRRCKSSTYAKAMGVYTDSSEAYKGNCWWWLRSPGNISENAAFVHYYGFVSDDGGGVDYRSFGVRAALNLSLSSNVWKDAGAVGSKEGDIFFRVTYKANGGSGEPGPHIKNAGTSLSLSSMKPVQSGYTFLGWSENSTATTADYKAGDEYKENDNAVFYAVWKKDHAADIPAENVTKAKNPQKITTKASVFTKAYGSKAFSLGARADGGAKLTYKSANDRIARVSGSGKVTVKKYGTVKITICAEETKDYKPAVKTVTIKVVPKAVSLKSVKSPSRKLMKISWKRNKDATGYEVYLSRRKDFKKWTIRRTYKKGILSQTLKNCESGKVYYVKVRACKRIGKTKYYGEWSKVRKVKVK